MSTTPIAARLNGFASRDSLLGSTGVGISEKNSTMTPADHFDEIARRLDKLAPHWLPPYDLNAYAAQVDAECGYSSDMMVATEVNTRVFEEVAAFVQLCGAFAQLNPTAVQQYVRVRDDRTEIDGALAQNAAAGCPTYARLLTLLVHRGVLAQRLPATTSGEV